MIPEERLREAITKVDDEILAGLPNPQDFPPGDRKKLSREAKKIYRRTTRPVLYWTKQSIACILLVALIGGASLLTFSTEARAAFFGWVREVYETHFAYVFSGEEAVDPEDIVYVPTWLPDGYNLMMAPKPGGQVTSIYTDDVGKTIFIAYMPDSESGTVQILDDEEDMEATPVFVNGNSADFYYDKEENASSTLVWVDVDRNVIFWISAPLEESEIIKIAESIETKKYLE